MGLLQLSGQGFVGDVQQLIFAPYKAYQQELKDWHKEIDDLLSQSIFESQVKANTPPALMEVTNAINTAIRGKRLSPPPVFKAYHTDDSYTLSQQRTSEEGGKIEAGINVPTLGTLSVGGNVDAKQQDSAQEVHKVTADVATADYPDADVSSTYDAAAQLWLLNKFAVPIPAATAKTGA